MNERFDGGQGSIAARSRLSLWLAEHKRPVQFVLAALWIAGLVYFLETRGLVQARDWVFVFLIAALLIFSVGDFDRWFRGVFLDWVPFAVILFAYDFLRGVTDKLGWKVHYLFAIKDNQPDLLEAAQTAFADATPETADARTREKKGARW